MRRARARSGDTGFAPFFREPCFGVTASGGTVSRCRRRIVAHLTSSAALIRHHLERVPAIGPETPRGPGRNPFASSAGSMTAWEPCH
jgi:hypothetical protein